MCLAAAEEKEGGVSHTGKALFCLYVGPGSDVDAGTTNWLLSARERSQAAARCFRPQPCPAEQGTSLGSDCVLPADEPAEEKVGDHFGLRSWHCWEEAGWRDGDQPAS